MNIENIDLDKIDLATLKKLADSASEKFQKRKQNELKDMGCALAVRGGFRGLQQQRRDGRTPWRPLRRRREARPGTPRRQGRHRRPEVPWP
jgi:hypothetical protein